VVSTPRKLANHTHYPYRFKSNTFIKMPRKILNPKVAPSGRIRGPVEMALLEIAAENGLKVTETTFEEAARAKGASRARDTELIRTGKATPEQIQKKNSISSGPFRVVDYSPLFSALDEAQA